MKKHKITLLKGALIGDTQWWTQEDWDKHNANVDKLKANGEYLKPVDFEFSMPDKSPLDEEIKPIDFSNCGFLIPRGEKK